MSADEQARADIGVREAVAREARDLDLLGGQLPPGLDPAFAHALAGGQQLTLGAPGERLGAHGREQLERITQLMAGVDAAPLAAQPLAIEQVGPRKLHAHAGARQPLERLLIEALGGLAVAEQRARAGLDPERPVAAAGPGEEREPLERTCSDSALPGAGGRFDELGDRAGRAQLGVGRDIDSLAHRGEGLLEATQTVVQDSAGVSGPRESEALPPRPRIRGEVLDQRRLASALRGDPDLDVAMRGDADRRGSGPDLVEQRLRRGQLAAQHLDIAECAEEERHGREGTGITGTLELSRSEQPPALLVPDVARGAAGE